MLLAVTLCGLALVACINGLVDPKALWSPNTGGILERPRVTSGGGRLHKSERIARGDWDAIILGSSRCENSIDPRDPAFVGLKTYNACLARSNMAESLDFGRFARDTNPHLKRVMLALDFFAFTGRRDSYGDFDDTQMAGNSKTGIRVRYLLSLDVLWLSLETLWDNIAHRRCVYLDNGFHDEDLVPTRVPPRRRFNEILTQDYLVSPVSFGAYRYDAARVSGLSDFLKSLAARHIQVWLYIPPIHAIQTETIYRLGLGPAYEHWLSDMARVAADRHIRLFDFSGYNSITTDTVPKAGDRHETRWFWESSHAKAVVGRMILKRLSGRANASVPADFGRELSPQTLPAVLQNLHAGRTAYTNAHPYEVANVARLAAQTAPVRARLHKIYGMP